MQRPFGSYSALCAARLVGAPDGCERREVDVGSSRVEGAVKGVKRLRFYVQRSNGGRGCGACGIEDLPDVGGVFCGLSEALVLRWFVE